VSLQEQNEEIQAQSEELTETNTSLFKVNRDLAERQEEIQAQAEELTEANQSLTLLNMELAEKTEELAAQSEELKESNQVISSLNQNLESKVIERTQSLEQAYKELDTFFYRSSHDFRRPLTTFMGLAEVAKITVKDQNALDLFDKVKETAVNLDRMLIKLQSISDVAAEQFAVKGISFRSVLDDAFHVYHQELTDANIQVEVRIRIARDIITYPAFLKIVVENLLENAIRFQNQIRPQIVFEVTEINGGLLLIVEDNGIGIEEIYVNRVFDMFFRGSQHSKGNGLGLYIVKKAVEKMKGHVAFESKYGQGSRVLVWLPFSLA
jgi:signal transduction histidine kinase